MAKADTSLDDCDDALGCSEGEGRFVVCDGAATASYSAEWARLLANRFVAEPPQIQANVSMPLSEIDAWLDPVQREWHNLVPWSTLDYFASRKAHMGGYATLAGICLETRSKLPEGGWAEKVRGMSVIVGDACIFWIREGRIYQCWPYADAREFLGPPYAIASLPEYNGLLEEHWQAVSLEPIQAGDLVILATDGISAFLLASLKGEEKERVEAVECLNAIFQLTPDQAMDRFHGFVEDKRRLHKLRDDDIAIILVNFSR
jgi:serine/threonine protein phosphatase PrpC